MGLLTVTQERQPRLVDETEWRQFRNWAYAWLLLPNLPFMAMWFIGCPPRAGQILFMAVAGLMVRGAGLPLRIALFLFMFSYALATFVCNFFDLSTRNLVDSVLMLDALNPAASLEYQLAGLGAIAVAVVGMRFLRQDATFKSPLLMIAALASASLLAIIDTAATWSNRGNYLKAAPSDGYFGSGVTHSGLLSGVAQRRNIMVVVVEALGQPLDPNIAELLMEPWKDPRIVRRYEGSHGTSPFFGSTTAGEIRELCGRWGNYDRLLHEPDQTCLPHKLRTKGYRTTAVHSFDGDMFRRSTWYPNAGFQEMIFDDTLLARGARRCPGAFPGACDTDVPRLLAAKLQTAREPQFLYWLTVNSHLPLARRDGRCREYSAKLFESSPMTCRLFRIYSEVSRAISDQIVADHVPPTDILLVGDHMPPFFDRWNRARFDPQHVPWILLKHR